MKWWNSDEMMKFSNFGTLMKWWNDEILLMKKRVCSWWNDEVMKFCWWNKCCPPDEMMKKMPDTFALMKFCLMMKFCSKRVRHYATWRTPKFNRCVRWECMSFVYVINISSSVHPSALWGAAKEGEDNEDRGGGSLHEVLEPVLSG